MTGEVQEVLESVEEISDDVVEELMVVLGWLDVLEVSLDVLELLVPEDRFTLDVPMTVDELEDVTLVLEKPLALVASLDVNELEMTDDNDSLVIDELLVLEGLPVDNELLRIAELLEDLVTEEDKLEDSTLDDEEVPVSVLLERLLLDDTKVDVVEDKVKLEDEEGVMTGQDVDVVTISVRVVVEVAVVVVLTYVTIA